MEDLKDIRLTLSVFSAMTMYLALTLTPSNLLIENQKSHELFQKNMKEYKEKEIAKLEKIKAQEKYEESKKFITYSIDYILDNVDIEIETIEYNKTIATFNDEIAKFQNNITLRKAELEHIKQKQLQEIEHSNNHPI